MGRDGAGRRSHVGPIGAGRRGPVGRLPTGRRAQVGRIRAGRGGQVGRLRAGQAGATLREAVGQVGAGRRHGAGRSGKSGRGADRGGLAPATRGGFGGIGCSQIGRGGSRPGHSRPGHSRPGRSRPGRPQGGRSLRRMRLQFSGADPAGLLQRRGERPAARVAVLRGLGQAPEHDLVHPGGQVGTRTGQRGRGRGQLGPHDGQALIAPEWRGARQHLERRARQRVGVGAAVHRAALDLLGGQVVQGAEHLPGQGEVGGRLGGLADAEVRQVDMILRAVLSQAAEQHIGRLHVPVHQAAGVRRVQRGGHLGHDPGGAGRRQRASPVQQAVHVLAADVAHRDEEHATGLAGVEDRDDVRVVHRRRGAGFPDEPPPEGVVPGQVPGEDLQRHPAAQPDVTGPVDHGHAAPADLLDHLVAGDLQGVGWPGVGWYGVGWRGAGWPRTAGPGRARIS